MHNAKRQFFRSLTFCAYVCSYCILLIVLHIFLGGSLVSDDSKSSVTITSQLLGLNEEELKRSLTSRVMITSKGGTVGTIIKLVFYVMCKIMKMTCSII